MKEWELNAWLFSLLFALYHSVEFSVIACPNSRNKGQNRATTKNIFYRFIYN